MRLYDEKRRKVKVGDIIEKGDILIGGYMEGKYTGIRNVHSLGEVKAIELIMLGFIEKFREAEIDFAFPSQSIYIESDNSKIEN